MTNDSYTISIENAHHTIEVLHNQLLERHVKIKKSDLKEVISSLLGFETSNVLDAKIKKYKEKQDAQCVFDRLGHHKYVRDLVKKSTKDPLRLYDYFKKHPSFTTFIIFFEDFEAAGGYKFSYGDVLFTRDKYNTIKEMLNWNSVTKIEFKHWKDEWTGEQEVPDGGYWALEFVGDGDEQFLGRCGENYLDSSSDSHMRLNSPDMPVEEVTNFFIDEVVDQVEIPFSVDDRLRFASYLRDRISENYGETFAANDEQEFIKHIEKFLPYLGINEIVATEVGEAPLAFLKILKNYGARFDAPILLDNALFTGDMEICQYLLEQGNRAENLLLCKWSEFNITYFHDRINWIDGAQNKDGLKLIEATKKYYISAEKLGISINSVDADGCSVLHYAARHDYGPLYEFFISLGADAKLKNKKGDTPEIILQAAIKQKEESQAEFRSIADIFFQGFDTRK